MSLRIDPEFQALIAPLQPDEREQLEANVVAHGCRDPLVVWRGYLIDGHNRHEICERRGIKYRTVEMVLLTREHVLLWIEENQLGRRNLTDDQRAVIAYSVLERREAMRKKERARKGGKAGGRHHPKVSLEDTAAPKLTVERSRPAVAKAARISERKLRTVGEVQKKRKDALSSIRLGEKTIAQVKKEMREADREARRAVVPAAAVLPDRCELILGDIEAAPVAAESVDVIITDPPYAKEQLPVFAKLAAMAERWLKPGGSLLFMSGQIYLPEVLKGFEAHGLKYHWTVAYLLPGGQAARIWPRRVNQFWKPVFWFVKGEYQGAWIGDVVRSASNDNDKRFHEWGQSESGIAELVAKFSLPGETVLDPFMGGGTTGLVALKMGRRFIGIDNDPGAIAASKARLAS
jgi:site-specific DNA-methyltransferase (adenine-specific)